MSAIQMTCQRCGRKYIAGMVGSTPWPAHHCATDRDYRRTMPASEASLTTMAENSLAAVELTQAQVDQIKAIQAQANGERP